MRTTIRLDDLLLRQAKEYAARTGRTLTSVIEDALRELLSRGPRVGKGLKLPTFRGNGLREGIDLDSSAELLERMESE